MPLAHYPAPDLATGWYRDIPVPTTVIGENIVKNQRGVAAYYESTRLHVKEAGTKASDMWSVTATNLRTFAVGNYSSIYKAVSTNSFSITSKNVSLVAEAEKLGGAAPSLVTQQSPVMRTRTKNEAIALPLAHMEMAMYHLSLLKIENNDTLTLLGDYAACDEILLVPVTKSQWDALESGNTAPLEAIHQIAMIVWEIAAAGNTEMRDTSFRDISNVTLDGDSPVRLKPGLQLERILKTFVNLSNTASPFDPNDTATRMHFMSTLPNDYMRTLLMVNDWSAFPEKR